MVISIFSFSHNVSKRLLVHGHGREEERWPHNLEVPSSIPRRGVNLRIFSLAHTFGSSTGVVSRKQN